MMMRSPLPAGKALLFSRLGQPVVAHVFGLDQVTETTVGTLAAPKASEIPELVLVLPVRLFQLNWGTAPALTDAPIVPLLDPLHSSAAKLRPMVGALAAT